MGKKDPRIDIYIAGAAPFAKPILKHLRKVVHAGCPKVKETIKWRFPHFDYHGILCGMAAFKNHCTFGFWKSSLVFGKGRGDEQGMGQFGRITSMNDLPGEEVLIGYVRKAARLNEGGVKEPSERRKKPPLKTPPDLAAALGRNGRARKSFESFSPSNRRDYIEWLTEAKREETRQKRLKTAIEWMSEGKVRNWKYLPRST